VDRRQGTFGEQDRSFHQHHSDEEEEDEEGFARGRRRGPSVDEFLRGSELGRPVRTAMKLSPYCVPMCFQWTTSCVCVCVYVWTCVCMHVWVVACIHSCGCVPVCVHMRVLAHPCVFGVCMHV